MEETESSRAHIAIEEKETEWKLCCSNSSISCVKYFSQLGAIGFSIIFSSVMIGLFPHDLEIRSTFMPLLSGMIMLLVSSVSRYYRKIK